MEGPVPDGNGDVPGPVEARREVIEQDDTFHMFALLLASVSIPVLIWLTRPVWDTPYRPWLVFFVGGISIVVISAALILREHQLAWKANRAVLRVDGVRLFEDERLLRGIWFDEDTLVDTFSDGPSEGSVDGVLGYYFRHGLRVVEIDSVFRGYSQEDVARMLPVVMAAVEKHGMKKGENLDRLMAGTSS